MLKEAQINVQALKAEIKVLENIVRAGKHENKEKQRAFSKWERETLADKSKCHYYIVYEYRKEHGQDSAPWSPKCGLHWEIERLTKLYQLRAHMRGRTHMLKEKVYDEYGNATGVLHRDLKWQDGKVRAFLQELFDGDSNLLTSIRLG